MRFFLRALRCAQLKRGPFGPRPADPFQVLAEFVRVGRRIYSAHPNNLMTAIKSSLFALTFASRSLLAVAFSGIAAIAFAAEPNQTLTPMIHISGNLRFGQQQAKMTHLYFRRKTTDDGHVLALLFASRPLPSRALDDRQKLLQLAQKGEFLGLYAEVAEAGVLRQSEVYHDAGAFSGPWTLKRSNSSTSTEGRIATNEEGDFFGKRFSVDVKFKVDGTPAEKWSGSPILETKATGLPLGRADGWIERLGKRTELTHAVALEKTDLFGEGGDRSLLLTNQPVPDQMLAAPRGVERELQKTGIAVLRVRMSNSGEIESITAPTDDGQAMTFSSNQWELELSSAPAKELDGSMASPGKTNSDSEHPSFQIRFHAGIKMVGPAAPVTAESGIPLPKDGGEPGKSYRGFIQALKTAKAIEDLLPLRVAALAGELTAMPAEQRRAMLGFLQAQARTPLEIVGGFANETQATLWLAGSQDGERMAGRLNVHHENGAWKLGAESYRMGGQN
jgi:hypothetical protein